MRVSLYQSLADGEKLYTSAECEGEDPEEVERCAKLVIHIFTESLSGLIPKMLAGDRAKEYKLRFEP